MELTAKTATEYIVKLGDFNSGLHPSPAADADILIGGKDSVVGSKVVPQVYFEKWNKEAWLSVNHKAQIVTDEKATFADGNLALKVGEIENQWYVKQDGRLEWEFRFDKKPVSNILDLELKSPYELDFWYQDSLENDYAKFCEKNKTEKSREPFQTLADWLKVFKRPDDVVGSYAVYWSKQNNQYRTGKFAHIYRPELIDSKGQRAWCELWIDETGWTVDEHGIATGSLRITMPKDFLDSAVYPVILDPTWGITSLGGTAQSGISGYMLTNRQTTGVDDTFTVAKLWTGIHGDTTDTTGTYHIKVAMSTGTTAALIDGQEIRAINTDNAFVDVPYSLTLSGSTNYYFVQLIENNSTAVALDNPGTWTGYYQWNRGYANDIPDPLSGLTSNTDWRVSCYVESGAAGGEPSIIPLVMHNRRQLGG